MVSKDIINRIRSLEFKTRRMLSGVLVGDHTTAVKGSGFEFDQIMPYEQGDDVRFIDWKSSAKTGKMLVKQYLEDKNRDITICVDVSASTLYSSGLYSSGDLKKTHLIQNVAGVVALISEMAKDRISLILFSDKIEAHFQMGTGPAHTKRLITKIFEHEPELSSKTDINMPIEFVIKNGIKGGIVFLISDFITEKDFSHNLKILNKRSEVVVIQCLDRLEQGFENLGIINFQDMETSHNLTLNTKRIENSAYLELANFLKRYNILFLNLRTDEDYISSLIKFFKKRFMY